jgi:hypothetical protein
MNTLPEEDSKMGIQQAGTYRGGGLSAERSDSNSHAWRVFANAWKIDTPTAVKNHGSRCGSNDKLQQASPNIVRQRVASLERYYHAPGRGIDQLGRCL